MGRFFLTLFLAILMLAAFVGSLVAADKIGLIKLEELILKTVSAYPKLKDLPKSYALGKVENSILEREKHKLQVLQKKLRLKEEQLAKAEKKLRQDQVKLQNQLKQNLTPKLAEKSTPIVSQTQVKQLPVDPKALKQYLETFNLMKPTKVAAVLQKLPNLTVLEILKATEGRQTAKIFECLPAEYLASLTKQQMSR